MLSSSFDAKPKLDADGIRNWKMPIKYRRDEGLYGQGGKYAIAANIDNFFRIFETYPTIKEANEALRELGDSSILTACDLYVVFLDAWVPVPFKAQKETEVILPNEKNPFQQYLKTINADAETASNRCKNDDGTINTAYDMYLNSVKQSAFSCLQKNWNKIMKQADLTKAMKIVQREMNTDSSGNIMRDFKNLQQIASKEHLKQASTEVEVKTNKKPSHGKKKVNVADVICGEKERNIRNSLL